MASIAVYGHCSLDRIAVGGDAPAAGGDALGGPACYCGITAARLGFDAELHTRHGPDFPAAALAEAGRGRIRFAAGAASEAPTTRFSIDIADGGASRRLVLGCACDGVRPGAPAAADGAIVSPLIGEVPAAALAAAP